MPAIIPAEFRLEYQRNAGNNSGGIPAGISVEYRRNSERYVFSVQGERFICSQDKVLNNGRAETQVCSSKQGTDKLNRQILANVVNLLKTSVCAACASNSFVNVNTEI